jgi:hypothetical protein
MSKRKRAASNEPTPLTATHNGQTWLVVGLKKAGYNDYHYLLKCPQTRVFKVVKEKDLQLMK